MLHKNQKKNRYLNRKSFTIEELNSIKDRHLTQDNFLVNPFSNIEYKTSHGLLQSLSIAMDSKSFSYYKYIVLPKKKCNICDIELSFKERMRKRCISCDYMPNGQLRRYFLDEERTIQKGKRITETKLEFYKTDKGKETSKQIGIKNSANMIKFNATPQGLENITNSWTHWTAVIQLDDGTQEKFRSSWEACFWYCNQHLQYEKIRIPYLDIEGNKHSYIADFYNQETNSIYELKPKGQWFSKNDKMQQVIDYCLNNSISFIWINEYNMMNYIDKTKFLGENLKQLEKMLIGVKHYDEIKDKKNIKGNN